MMFRPTKLNPFFIIPAFFLILSTFFSLSIAQQNGQNQSDGIMRLMMRKLEEDDQEEARNYSVKLVEAQTKRPDPLDNFNDYKGGWDIKNDHYLASVCFSSAPFLILAVVWFVVFGIFLLCACICCCCCHRNKPYGYSRVAYACSLTFLIVFTIGAIVGCGVMYTGEGRFLDSVDGVTKYLVDRGFSIYDKVLGIENTLLQAKNLVLNRNNVPDELKGEVDKVNKLIDSVGSLPRIKSADITDKIKKILSHVNIALMVITSLMLLLAFLGFLFSIFGMKTCVYILVVIGWIIITLTFILCGIFLVFHNIVADTCNAMDEWVQNPMADTAIKEILPCWDFGITDEIKNAGKEVTQSVNGLVNAAIEGANENTKVSGPHLPLICDPYIHGDSPENCTGQVPLKNASSEWKKYVCEISEDGFCTTPGRLTPRIYEELVKAANVSDGLYQSSDFVASIADCSLVKDTMSNITQNHCPGLKKHSEWVYIGLVTATCTIMFSMFVWVLYARERRHRKYTKRINKGYDESPLVGGKKL